MGSKVFANGLPVATTTSGHIAANTGAYDVRLLGKEKVERLSFVLSKNLKKNRSAITLFDKGYVWRQSTEAGAPSDSDAGDKLPGAKNGMVVDGHVTVADGVGSPNVYVENEKVECESHLTKQNIGATNNSAGEIMDPAKFAAEREAFKRRQAELAALEAARRAKAARDAALARARELAQKTQTPAPGVQPKNEALASLGITGVIVKEGAKRIQAPGEPSAASGPLLEITRKGTVEVEVQGPGAAKAIITTPGGRTVGAKASYVAGGTLSNAASGVLEAIVGANIAANPVGGYFLSTFTRTLIYREDTVTVTSEAADLGSYTRRIIVYPESPASISMSAGGTEYQSVKDKLEKLVSKLQRFMPKPLEGKVEFWSVQGQLEGKWEEEDDGPYVFFKLGLSVTGFAFKGEIGVELPIPVAFPGAAPIYGILQKVADFLDIDLPGLFFEVKLIFEVGASASIAAKYYRNKSPALGITGDLKLQGKIGLRAALILKITKRIRGSAGIEGYFEAECAIIPKFGEFKLTAKADFVANLIVDIGIWEFEGSKRIPLGSAELI